MSLKRAASSSPLTSSHSPHLAPNILSDVEHKTQDKEVADELRFLTPVRPDDNQALVTVISLVIQIAQQRPHGSAMKPMELPSKYFSMLDQDATLRRTVGTAVETGSYEDVRNLGMFLSRNRNSSRLTFVA
jgi:hypothetical protein